MDINTLREDKVFNVNTILEKVAFWKKQNLKIVFTNGCFDLIHVGHLSYLMKASELGSKLIVGLNSDSSVRVLKGEKRPINNESSRSIMLASLFFVDAVIVFYEDTPLNLIKLIMPNVLVKGGDYEIENVVGAIEVKKNGGSVEIVEFLDGYSSTNIINRISNN